MDKNYLIPLTNKLYKLTLLFPQKEPLRYKMRELADNILAKCLGSGTANNSPVAKDIEILDSFFEIVKNQNWAKKEEILNLQNDYSKIREELKNSKLEEKKIGDVKVEVIGTVGVEPQQQQNEKPEAAKSHAPVRQDKILEILREKGRAQVGDIKKIFPEITKRTLRRDFRDLLKKGTIEMLGERNETFYKIKH